MAVTTICTVTYFLGIFQQGGDGFGKLVFVERESRYVEKYEVI